MKTFKIKYKNLENATFPVEVVFFREEDGYSPFVEFSTLFVRKGGYAPENIVLAFAPGHWMTLEVIDD